VQSPAGASPDRFNRNSNQADRNDPNIGSAHLYAARWLELWLINSEEPVLTAAPGQRV
jgi:hypothetical protein